jgi:hypothetical protein
MTSFFNLEHSIAPRLIRVLYVVVAVLIAIFVILGVVRGITVATRMPRPGPAITAQAPADSATMPAPPAGARGAMMGPRRFVGRGFGRGYGPGPGRVFGIRAARYPAVAGGFIILRSLVMGFIALFVVRILAEMALAVLNLPRRGEA